jgi:hypothetical protein
MRPWDLVCGCFVTSSLLSLFTLPCRVAKLYKADKNALGLRLLPGHWGPNREMAPSPRLMLLWVWNLAGLNESDCVVKSMFVPKRREATGSWINLRDERPNLLLFVRCYCDDHIKKNMIGAWQTRKMHTTFQLENLKQIMCWKLRRYVSAGRVLK